MKRTIFGMLLTIAALQAEGASGQMGTGIPNFGSFSAATGIATHVWSLASATVGFPPGCSYITLTPTTMGMDSYKIAVSTLIAAKVSGKSVEFYAHATRDSGCGVDYVRIAN